MFTANHSPVQDARHYFFFSAELHVIYKNTEYCRQSHKSVNYFPAFFGVAGIWDLRRFFATPTVTNNSHTK